MCALWRHRRRKGKISSFGQTQIILDSAAVGTGVWSKVTEHFSNFCGSKQNLWLTKLGASDNSIKIEGYALSKFSPTELAYTVDGASLKGIFAETIREAPAYRFDLDFNLSQFPKVTQ